MDPGEGLRLRVTSSWRRTVNLALETTNFDSLTHYSLLPKPGMPEAPASRPDPDGF